MRGRHVVITSLVLAVAVFAASQATANHPTTQATPFVHAGPGATNVGYDTPVVVGSKGAPVMFHNHDIAYHNVVALDAFRPDGSAPWCAYYAEGTCPLFRSALIPLLGHTPVEGVGDLEIGVAYTFYCTLHPWMVGEIVMLP